MAAWDSVALTKDLTTFPSPFSPIIGNPDFTQALNDEGYRERQVTGCKHAGDLFGPEGLQSFERLRDSHGLSEGERWRYIHVRHWVTHPLERPLVGRPSMEFE